MIIVNLKGGLGNQMFQYALGKSLSIKYNRILKFDLNFYKENLDAHVTKRNFELEHFSVKADPATKQDLKFKKSNRVTNFFTSNKFKIYNDLNFGGTIESNNSIVYFDGFWQSELFFQDIRNLLLREFTPKISLDADNMFWINSISRCNSISVHIRRGDYITNSSANSFHGVCSIEYYKSAIRYIQDIVDNPIFYFFSDDMTWVKENFYNGLQNYNFVEGNIGENSYLDIRLMSFCKHNIVANSTFSWWGAWLNTNVDKVVIAPLMWFSDSDQNSKTKNLIPSSWVRI